MRSELFNALHGKRDFVRLLLGSGPGMGHVIGTSAGKLVTDVDAIFSAVIHRVQCVYPALVEQ